MGHCHASGTRRKGFGAKVTHWSRPSHLYDSDSKRVNAASPAYKGPGDQGHRPLRDASLSRSARRAVRAAEVLAEGERKLGWMADR